MKKVAHDLRYDRWYRAEAAVRFSCLVNFVYSSYQSFMACRMGSIWFATLAGYYLALALTRMRIIRFLRPDAQDGREELRRYRRSGIWLLMLTFAVVALGILVNFAGRHPVYPGSMIFMVAGFTLYSVILALVNLLRYRNLESPLISASKAVAMACTLISLYSLQAGALAKYCTGDLVWLRQLLNTVSALVIMIIVAWLAIHIIVRATRALQGKEDLSIVALRSADEAAERLVANPPSPWEQRHPELTQEALRQERLLRQARKAMRAGERRLDE